MLAVVEFRQTSTTPPSAGFERKKFVFLSRENQFHFSHFYFVKIFSHFVCFYRQQDLRSYNIMDKQMSWSTRAPSYPIQMPIQIFFLLSFSHSRFFVVNWNGLYKLEIRMRNQSRRDTLYKWNWDNVASTLPADMQSKRNQLKSNPIDSMSDSDRDTVYIIQSRLYIIFVFIFH